MGTVSENLLPEVVNLVIFLASQIRYIIRKQSDSLTWAASKTTWSQKLVIFLLGMTFLFCVKHESFYHSWTITPYIFLLCYCRSQNSSIDDHGITFVFCGRGSHPEWNNNTSSRSTRSSRVHDVTLSLSLSLTSDDGWSVNKSSQCAFTNTSVGRSLSHAVFNNNLWA